MSHPFQRAGIVTRRAVVAGLSAIGVAHATRRGGAPPASTPVLPNFTTLGLTNNTWTTSGVAVTIGAVIATTDIPASLAGATVTISDVTNFQLTNGGIYPCSVQAKAGLAGGSYDFTLTIAKSGFGNTPFTSPTITVTGSSAGAALPLVRVLARRSGVAGNSSANSFVTFMQPFAPGEVSGSQILTATVGGTATTVVAYGRDYYANGYLKRAEIVAGPLPTIAADTPQTLVLFKGAGSWPTTTNRTNADWAGLVDTVEITNLTTTGTSGPDMDGAGTWIAALDAGATNTIEVYGQGRHLYVWITVPFKNGATTHRFLDLQAAYLVTQLDDGTLGPIALMGFFLRNIVVLGKSNLSEFRYDVAWKRNNVTQRSETGVRHPSCSRQPFVERRGRWVWTANDPQLWVSQDYTLTRKTKMVPPFQDGIVYSAAAQIQPTTSVTSINTTTGLFTTTSVVGLFGSGRLRPNACEFYAGTLPTGGQLAADTTYWIVRVNASTFYVYDTLDNAMNAVNVVTAASWSSGTLTFTMLFDPGISVGGSFTISGMTQTGNDTGVTYNGTFTAISGTSGTTLKASLAGNPGTATVTFNATISGMGTLSNSYNSTGRVIPTGTYSGVVAKLCLAPTTTAQWIQTMGDPGSQPNISLISEWGAYYHTWGTEFAQDMARVQAFAFMTIPNAVIDPATGRIPNLLNTSVTGMGTPTPTTKWAPNSAVDFSTDMSGPSGPTKGHPANGLWLPETSHYPAGPYAVWIMEGGPWHRDVLVEEANRALGNLAFLPRRNIVMLGTTYYGQAVWTYSQSNTRAGAWSGRALDLGYTAAEYGSPEKEYLKTVIVAQWTGFSAYLAIKGTAFSHLGVICWGEQDPPLTASSKLDVSQGQSFMQTYHTLTWGFAALKNADLIPELGNFANHAAQWLNHMYNSAFCSYFATCYTVGWGATDYNSLYTSGVYFGDDPQRIGPGGVDSTPYDYVSGNSVIHWRNTPSPNANPPFNPVVGDKFRPSNSMSLQNSLGPGPHVPAPAPFVDGTDYYVVSIDIPTKAFEVSATPGGTPIVAAGNATASGGYFLPYAFPCPATGTAGLGTTNPDSYLGFHIGACGLHTLYGSLATSAAYDEAFSRYTGNFNTLSGFAFQNTV